MGPLVWPRMGPPNLGSNGPPNLGPLVWALMGPPSLGPHGPGPTGPPWALQGRAIQGRALMGSLDCALMGPKLIYQKK